MGVKRQLVDDDADEIYIYVMRLCVPRFCVGSGEVFVVACRTNIPTTLQLEAGSWAAFLKVSEQETRLYSHTHAPFISCMLHNAVHSAQGTSSII